MSLKFIYVLISGENDYYAEQALVSMHSLRLHNPDAHIVLVTDDRTLISMTGHRELIKSYINELVTVNPPADFTPVQRSRFLKTTLRQTLSGDFLYIDNDTIVTGTLDELDRLDCEVGAVPDCHAPARLNWQLNKYLETTKKEYWGTDIYFNGGILLVRDTVNAARLFLDWHTIWNEERVAYGVSIDQPSLSQADLRNGFLIRPIADKFNCQIVKPRSRKFMLDARIVHYSAESPRGNFFPLKRKEWLNIIREEGINEEVEAIVLQPIIAYLEHADIMSRDDLKKYEAPMVTLALKLSRDFPWTNKMAKLLYKMFGYEI